MPVRSLNSCVLIWPNREQVLQALQEWAEKAKAQDPKLLRVGYFGSYARGDWGVGSDLDVILILTQSDLPFERRAAEFDLTTLPVPVDVLVYTAAEWQQLTARHGRKPWWQEMRWV